jgi:hypothetical protein
MDEVGFKPMMTELRRRLTPLLALLFPHWMGDRIDHHHSFVVRYKIGEDLDLARHMDESEITINVNLGREFEGGEVYFNELRDYQPSTSSAGIAGQSSRTNELNYTFPSVGTAIVHAGQHFHGAHPLRGGERVNLIMWLTSSEHRAGAPEVFIAQCAHVPWVAQKLDQQRAPPLWKQQSGPGSPEHSDRYTWPWNSVNDLSEVTSTVKQEL